MHCHVSLRKRLKIFLMKHFLLTSEVYDIRIRKHYYRDGMNFRRIFSCGLGPFLDITQTQPPENIDSVSSKKKIF